MEYDSRKPTTVYDVLAGISEIRETLRTYIFLSG